MRKIFLFISFFISLFCFRLNAFAANTTSCSYSLRTLDATTINRSSGMYSLSSKSNVSLSPSSMLYMNISNTYNSGSVPNISFEIIKLKDDVFLGSNFNQFYFSAAKDINNLSDSEGLKKLEDAKKCPDLSFIYYKDGSKYYIVSIGFDKFSDENQTLSDLTTIFEGQSVPSNFTLMLVKTVKNNSSTSADNSSTGTSGGTTASGTFCASHPEHLFCKTKTLFQGEKSYDNSSFSFCDSKGVLKGFRIVHIIMIIARVLVPIILIVSGTILFFKAMLSDDEKNLINASKSFILSIIVALVVFFIPTIVNAIVGLVKKDDSTFTNCKTCLSESFDNCDKIIKNAGGD